MGGRAGSSVSLVWLAGPPGVIVEVCEIVCETHDPVLDADLVASPEEEPPEAPVVLDLSKDGFDVSVALTAERAA